MDFDVWGPPLIVLGFALVGSLFWVFRFQSKAVKDSKEEDFAAEKKRYIESLRELEADSMKMDPDAYQREREALLDKAESVLKQVDERKVSQEKVQRKTAALQSTGYLIGLVVLGAILSAGLYRYSRDRVEGEVMTGASLDNAEKDTRLADARKALEANPQDLDALNTLAYDALINRRLQEAMNYMETAREIAPGSADVLVHLGILQLAVKMNDKALLNFNTALEKDPNLGKAYLWRALLYSNLGNKEEALADAKRALPLVKQIEEKRFLSTLMEEIDKPPPILSGVLNIENPGSGVVFVIARRAKEGGGPPVAVQKHSPRKQIKFELGKSDMVMGGVWPEEIWLEARLDTDGNAMSKSDSDRASEVLGPIKGVQSGLTLQITGTTREDAQAETSTAGAISGRLLADGAPKGTLFIIARRSEATVGPPAAVKKIADPVFPLSFSMGKDDMMMGGDWPEKVWLQVRLDLDGNPMTKTPEDWLSPLQGPIAASTDKLEITLSPQE
ncbi:MAG: tetratricopeptide repeat protein [Myxococcota bacterium]|nr:tetratricopeptide repeat protein [Myxococcota bacterium]